MHRFRLYVDIQICDYVYLYVYLPKSHLVFVVVRCLYALSRNMQWFCSHFKCICKWFSVHIYGVVVRAPLVRFIIPHCNTHIHQNGVVSNLSKIENWFRALKHSARSLVRFTHDLRCAFACTCVVWNTRVFFFGPGCDCVFVV